MGFAPEKSTDGVLIELLKMDAELQETQHATLLNQFSNAMAMQRLGDKVNPTVMENLKRQCTELEEKQNNEWVPLLNKSMGYTDRYTQECEQVKKIAEEWEKEPAQFLVPWVTLEGSNFREWSQMIQSLVVEINQ